MGIKFEFSLLGRSHIHWDETGCRDVIVEVSHDDLSTLALANGYVKLEPEQVADMMERWVSRQTTITAAIDAASKG
jgi:hypothetical protein